MKLTQTTGPMLGEQKPKGRQNPTFFQEGIQLSWKPGKRRPQTQKVKIINNEKAEKYYTNEGKNQKHKVQINEEETGKLPLKEFRMMKIKMIKNNENKDDQNP